MGYLLINFVFINLIINTIFFSVRMYGRNTSKNGNICPLHHERNWTQIADRHTINGHQSVFLSLQYVQSRTGTIGQCK